MSNVSIVDQLREMRLTAMAREFEAQSQDPATYSQIPFEERFGLIVNAGWNSQQASEQNCRSSKPDVLFSSSRMNLIKTLA